MSTVKTPVSGGGSHQGAPDGVSDTPGSEPGVGIQGRTAGGESGGGAYPNPQTGRKPTVSGFMGHGGQTDMAYHGGGQAGEQGGDAPNAATGSATSDGEERDAAPASAAEHKPHAAQTASGTISVIETSGVAEAESTGKVGTDAAYQREQESPGSG